VSDEERIRELEQRLADLEARLPRHSVPVAMMVEIEELEEELAALRVRRASVAQET
jgi:hypothetical protein